MAKYNKGGANRLDLFTLASTHESIGSSPVYTNQFLVTSEFSRTESGPWEATLTQLEDSPDFWAFLETYAPSTEASGTAEETLEDGTTIGGTTAASTDLLAVSYGPKQTPDSTEYRKLWVGVVKVSSDSGSYTQQNDTFSKPTLKITSQKLLTLLTVNGVFNTSLATNAVTTTLAANSYGKVVFIEPE